MGRIKRNTSKSLSILTTDMEISFRRKKFPNLQSLNNWKQKIGCTACGKNLSNDLKKGLICSHPALDVIICQDCLKFYGTGLYETAKNGDDIYCRWCAQGGTIYCCSKCSCAFCQKCIDRNFKNDKKVMSDIDKDDWNCFICQHKPLWNQRALCWAIMKYKSELEEGTRKRKLSVSSVESTWSDEPISKRKSMKPPGPASKTMKKPGPASKTMKKPGPASKTIKEEKVFEPRSTRGVVLDTSPKVIDIPFPKFKPTPKKSVGNTSSVKKTKPKVTPKKRSTTRKAAKRNDNSVDDLSDNVSSAEETEDHQEIEEGMKEPIQNTVQLGLNFCSKLSEKFNNKLLLYAVHYNHLNTVQQVNTICNNLHEDIRKMITLFSAMDKKMMRNLNLFNESQKIADEEEDHLDMVDEITAEVNPEDYEVTLEDINEANEEIDSIYNDKKANENSEINHSNGDIVNDIADDGSTKKEVTMNGCSDDLNETFENNAVKDNDKVPSTPLLEDGYIMEVDNVTSEIVNKEENKNEVNTNESKSVVKENGEKVDSDGASKQVLVSEVQDNTEEKKSANGNSPTDIDEKSSNEKEQSGDTVDNIDSANTTSNQESITLDDSDLGIVEKKESNTKVDESKEDKDDVKQDNVEEKDDKLQDEKKEDEVKNIEDVTKENEEKNNTNEDKIEENEKKNNTNEEQIEENEEKNNTNEEQIEENEEKNESNDNETPQNENTDNVTEEKNETNDPAKTDLAKETCNSYIDDYISKNQQDHTNTSSNTQQQASTPQQAYNSSYGTPSGGSYGSNSYGQNNTNGSYNQNNSYGHQRTPQQGNNNSYYGTPRGSNNSPYATRPQYRSNNSYGQNYHGGNNRYNY